MDDCVLAMGMETAAGTGSLGSLELRNSTTAVTGNTITYAAAAPATGTWKVGDIVFNSGVAAGGTVGWVCTTAGTPGTWKTFGVVAA